MKLRVPYLPPVEPVAGIELPDQIGSIGMLTTHVDSRGRLLDVELDTSSADYDGLACHRGAHPRPQRPAPGERT